MSIFADAVDAEPSFLSYTFLKQYPAELTHLQRSYQKLFYLLYATAPQSFWEQLATSFSFTATSLNLSEIAKLLEV